MLLLLLLLLVCMGVCVVAVVVTVSVHHGHSIDWASNTKWCFKIASIRLAIDGGPSAAAGTGNCSSGGCGCCGHGGRVSGSGISGGSGGGGGGGCGRGGQHLTRQKGQTVVGNGQLRWHSVDATC